MILFLFGCFLFFIGFLFLLLLPFFSSKNEYLLEKNKNENPSFTILIPARNESKVIEELLISIENQTRKVLSQNVFVIVESSKDPTIQICQKHHVSVIIRKHLDKKSKGYALEEAIEFLNEKQLFFDAYFIFDADNVLEKHFLEEMELDYKKGYTISTGYRNLKNADDGVIAAASGLTYLFLNEWINKQNLKTKKNVMISGTGFYLHGRLIKEWKTYPFHSLTEDMELNYYGVLHGLSTHYNEKAIFYDEQPTRFKQTVIQRKRWIRGFFINWFQAIPKLMKRRKEHPINKGSVISSLYGIFPAICIVFGLILLLFAIIFQIFCGASFWFFVLFLFVIYFFLVWITFRMLHHQRGKLKISKKMEGKVLWYHPIFLISYVYVFFLTLFPKKISWERVEHGK